MCACARERVGSSVRAVCQRLTLGNHETWGSGLMYAVVLVCSYLPLELGFVRFNASGRRGISGVLDLY